ncbi:hypothetical protein CRYUN_Cryun25bG0082300 [Craigia yunnanensis]
MTSGQIKKKVSAASARAHTRANRAKSSSFPAMIAPIVVALTVGLLGWAYQALKPPPPKICHSPDGPPVTSPRIKLGDGRHLAYREAGVPKEEARYKIVVIHGFDSSKYLNLPAPQELIEELKIYFLFFDREGASLVVPFVHYWWPCLPANLSSEAFDRLLAQDQWSFRVTHYTPWLFYWWMTQKWFPSLSIVAGNMAIFSQSDLEILKKWSEAPSVGQEKIRQQVVYESLYRDIMVSYGKWEFDPVDLVNPFPDNEGSVHI